MKFSTMTVVLAAALCMAGCKYDKAAKGGVPGDGKANASDIFTSADINANEGSLDSLSEAKFDDLYAKCTDVSFAPVYFRFDATKIEESELAKVEAVARHLADDPDRVVTIEGNCDERGSNEYNLSLGDDRAIIISNYLASNGIARNRMETVSRGETNPAVEGHGESAWSQNRRGEFIIWKK